VSLGAGLASTEAGTITGAAEATAAALRKSRRVILEATLELDALFFMPASFLNRSFADPGSVFAVYPELVDRYEETGLSHERPSKHHSL
jgi:hypothetical protein